MLGSDLVSDELHKSLMSVLESPFGEVWSALLRAGLDARGRRRCDWRERGNVEYPAPVPAADEGGLSQRAIYDERYRLGAYDQRSAVRVLTAEAQALDAAVRRVIESTPDLAEISLLDFGYGTGRVTNEFIARFPEIFGSWYPSLRVVAYDVSSVGMARAAGSLVEELGFLGAEDLAWEPEAETGYLAGQLRASVSGVDLTVVFVHGNEFDSPEIMTKLAREANHGKAFQVTTSWYSGIGHVPGRRQRDAVFAELGGVTDPRGELLIAVSGTGDLVEAQQEWKDRLERGEVGDYPIETAGDVMYETEIPGLWNYYHVFAEDLEEHISAVCGDGQRWWVEGVRFPDEEFTSPEEEERNHRRVVEFNESVRHRSWRAEDYQLLHTVVAIRSGSVESLPTPSIVSLTGQEERTLSI
jgi:SAM-dependent methyltransferase